MHRIWLRTQIRGKIFKQNLLKKHEKATALCKILNIFWESMSPDPPRAFFSICFKLTCRKGKRLEDVKIWCSSP